MGSYVQRIERSFEFDRFPFLLRRRLSVMLWFNVNSIAGVLVYLSMLCAGAVHHTTPVALVLWLIFATVVYVGMFALIRQGRVHLVSSVQTALYLVGILAIGVTMETFTSSMWMLPLVGLHGFLFQKPLPLLSLVVKCAASVTLVYVIFYNELNDPILIEEFIHLILSLTLLIAMAFMKAVLYGRAEARLTRNHEETHAALLIAQQESARATQMLAEARDLDEAKTQFLAAMNHELRTPLNAILGYTELLLEDASDHEEELLPEHFIDDAKRIKTASAHLIELLDDVLDVRQIEQGGRSMNIERFDLNRLCEEVVSSMEHAASIHHTALSYQFHKEIEVELDPGWIRQILLNLLSNAIKFTPSGHVDVTLHTRDQRILIEVQDDGRGMSAEDVAATKMKYVQASGQSVREHGGTGLGLPLCIELAEQLGGALDMSSALHMGTTVRVHLPLSAPRHLEAA